MSMASCGGEAVVAAPAGAPISLTAKRHMVVFWGLLEGVGLRGSDKLE